MSKPSAMLLLVVWLSILLGTVSAFVIRRQVLTSPSSLGASTSQSSSKSTTYRNKIKRNPLDASIIEGLQMGKSIILIVDTNNVRGKDDFRIWNADLLSSLQDFRAHHLRLHRQEMASHPNDDDDDDHNNDHNHNDNHKVPPPIGSLQIVYAMDHGCQPDVYSSESLDGWIVFAGPHRTADDVIAQATRFFCPSVRGGNNDNNDDNKNDDNKNDDNNNDNDDNNQAPKNNNDNLRPTITQVIVITSDGELKQRCLRSNQSESGGSGGGGGGGGRHKRKKRSLMKDGSSVKVFGSPSLVTSLKEVVAFSEKSSTTNDDFGSNDLQTSTARVESDIRWCTRLFPPFASGKEQVEAKEHGPWKSSLLAESSTDSVSGDDSFPKLPFSERTWHRVLVAEMMRQLLERFLERQLPSPSDHQSESESESENDSGMDYKSFYEQHQLNNDSGLPVETMFLDHRIRHAPYLQQELLQYFERSVASLSFDDTSNKREHGEEVTTTTTTSTTSWHSPSHSAAKLLQTIVAESPEKTQDEILLRYMHEAPSNLQFTRKQSLLELLRCIAQRAQRDGEDRKNWFLLEGSLETLLQDCIVQPGRSRRSQKRHASRGQSRGQGQVDEDLVNVGEEAEQAWFRKLDWNKLTNDGQ